MFVGVFFVFFFNQKTAYEMRISDWSSDVCSSDLDVDKDTVSLAICAFVEQLQEELQVVAVGELHVVRQHVVDSTMQHAQELVQRIKVTEIVGSKIGRASCRERVCQ